MKRWIRMALLAPVAALALAVAGPAAADPPGGKMRVERSAQSAQWHGRDRDWRTVHRSERDRRWEHRRDRHRAERRHGRWDGDRHRGNRWEHRRDHRRDRLEARWERRADQFERRAERFEHRGQYRAAAAMRRQAERFDRRADRLDRRGGRWQDHRRYQHWPRRY